MSTRKDDLGKRERFRIGDIDVHPDRNAIVRDGRDIGLAKRTMDLLVELARANGKSVDRARLLKKVWKNEELDDNPINKAMSELRDKLGDDRGVNGYIKTIRGGGYRTVAPIVFAKGYRARRKEKREWHGGNPYVGLAAFDERYADVFFGRSRMEDTVLRALRTQLDNGRRFVLLHGASGSGKTSLLRAGILPKLTRLGGDDDLLALAVAHCDLASAQPGDTLGALAAALASWALAGEPVFPPQAVADFSACLVETPESIERAIDGAFRRHPNRKAAEHPLAHLLLVIDHAEKLVDAASADCAMHERFARALAAVCDNERTLTVMIVRGDFYLKLQDALPDLIERKGSDGHIDVLRPQQWEIAEIIRDPAECADVDFEQDPESEDYLDNRLLDDAQGKPDVLPLLQHTLHQLYEQRDQANGLLTFAAYRAMGGLEGAIAHRAEEIFNSLPQNAQATLDSVLSKLIVVQNTGEASGRHTLIDTLDENALILTQAFIAARLFASEGGNHRPTFGVAHEALLRQWPRAVDWTKENQRLLQAKAHFRIAASRWDKENRSPDHLLNPGRPLSDAIEAASKLPGDLQPHERDYLQASTKLFARKRLVRRGAIAALAISTLVSIMAALLAQSATKRAALRQAETQSHLDYIVGELVEKIDPTGNLDLLESISTRAIQHYQKQPAAEIGIHGFVNHSRALNILGSVRQSQGDHAVAAYFYALSAQNANQAIDIQKDYGDAWFELSQAIFYLGQLEFTARNYVGADKYWLHYLRISKRFTQEFPNDIRWLMEESYALNNLGSSALRRGEPNTALDYFVRSTDLKRRIVAIDPSDMSNRYAWIDSKSWINSALAAKGEIRDASKGYTEAIDDLRALIKEKPSSNLWKFRLANYLMLSAQAEIAIGAHDKARTSAKDSVDILTRLTQIEPDNSEWAGHLVRAKAILAETAARDASTTPDATPATATAPSSASD